MKKALQIALLASVFTSLSALAHHPAEDVVSAETYEMITDNLEAVDSPHLDLDLSTMPSSTADMGVVRERVADVRSAATMRPPRR